MAERFIAYLGRESLKGWLTGRRKVIEDGIKELQRPTQLLSRLQAHRRICEMSGVDENGCLLPPKDISGIDRPPTSWWKNNAS